jgi:hypothetical protein
MAEFQKPTEPGEYSCEQAQYDIPAYIDIRKYNSLDSA